MTDRNHASMSTSTPDLANDRAAALALAPVSRETLARLDRYVALLLQRQRTINLIAPSTVPQVWTRHVADSLQLLALAPAARVWADIGSGGGFPGIVLACALADSAGAQVHLVESTRKKAAFLAEAAQALEIPATIHPIRAEEFARTFVGPLDAITARAVAPLPELLGLLAPLMKPGVVAVLPKGRDVEKELTAASKYWKMAYTMVPSRTSVEARILTVRSLARLSDRG